MLRKLLAKLKLNRTRGHATMGDQVVAVGLAIVVVLVVVTLVVSIYQTVTTSKGDQTILKNPEVVAIAVGLLLSVLFVERWRSVEGRLDKLSDEEQERLTKLAEFAKASTEQIVGTTVDKAEKLSARLEAIADDNPWLEVLTAWDITVETESVRGILRTSYNLLRNQKDLHLYEYLEFCSRKGTSQDERNSPKSLRGAPEDFLEIADFCEVWLDDYALGAEFLKRYVQGGGTGGYILMPELMTRLIRMGRFPDVATYALSLERQLRRSEWHRRFPFLATADPVSGRFCWKAFNVLALTYTVFGDVRRAARFSDAARGTGYAELFKADQRLFDTEILINAGDFEGALKVLKDSDEADDGVAYLHQVIFMYERMNRFELAAPLRERLQGYRSRVYGDGPVPAGFQDRQVQQNGHGGLAAGNHQKTGPGREFGRNGDARVTPPQNQSEKGPDDGHGRSA